MDKVVVDDEVAYGRVKALATDRQSGKQWSKPRVGDDGRSHGTQAEHGRCCGRRGKLWTDDGEDYELSI
ncbi:hypothetical protein BHE74_00049765, partial [Ensete ventricosum]